MANIIKLRDFIKQFENYKKLNKEMITMKTKVLDDLIDYIKNSDIKVAILSIQKNNLIIALKNKGCSDEEIKNILEMKGEKYGKI